MRHELRKRTDKAPHLEYIHSENGGEKGRGKDEKTGYKLSGIMSQNVQHTENQTDTEETNAENGLITKHETVQTRKIGEGKEKESPNHDVEPCPGWMFVTRSQPC